MKIPEGAEKAKGAEIYVKKATIKKIKNKTKQTSKKTIKQRKLLKSGEGNKYVDP